MSAAPLPPNEVRPPETLDSPDDSSFSLFDLVEEVVSAADLIARDKGLDLRRFISDDVPPRLAGDPGPLRRVLTTLLGNAVQFTKTGQVRLDIRPDSGPGEGLTGAGPLLRFTVIDTGIGIERDARARVFDGRSLSICRQIVRLMGGDLLFHSLPAEGATFWFTARFVPGRAAKLTPPPPTQPPPGRPLRFLIAEDNVVNQLVLAEQLTSLGHTSFTVSNGREALAAIENSPSWDAVLLDCQMPVMDGYETVAAIRQREAAGAPRLWTVAVTANALAGEREACLRAGMDDFLSKPFNIRQLAQVIARIPTPAGNPPRGIVDDSRLDALANSTTSGGENYLDKMARLFTESGREMLDQMEAALHADDIAAIGRLAHKLGGGCMYVGATGLRSLCAEAQRLARLDDHPAIHALVPLIRQEFNLVEQDLARGRPSP